MPRYSASEELWPGFENYLVDKFLKMETDDFVIYSHGSEVEFVQFVKKVDALGLWGEVAGPIRLGGAAPWTQAQERQIESIGWGQVSSVVKFPNYRIVWLPDPNAPSHALARSDARDAARMAVRTLTEVMRVPSPTDLDEKNDNMGH